MSRMRDTLVSWACSFALTFGGAACSPTAAVSDAGVGDAGSGGGPSGTGDASAAGGFPEVEPADDPFAPDFEDEPPADDPAASGPIGPDPAACELEDAPPAGACDLDDGAGEPPPADCAVPDEICDEPEFCPIGTDPDCADSSPDPADDAVIDPDCALPDGICDEPELCLEGTDPDCLMSAAPPAVDPACAESDGFCDEPEPCPEGTDPDCMMSEEPVPEPDPLPDAGDDPYGGVDDCGESNFDGVCDVDTGVCPPGTDATDCGGAVDDGGGVCPDPFAAAGTCTVVCCDRTLFAFQAPDAGTCAQQYRKCRSHRQTVAIGYAAPDCGASTLLFQRGPACRSCCAKCKKSRRYKFVDVDRKCTAAARMFCDDDRRGGLRRARWGQCGGPTPDLDTIFGTGLGDTGDSEEEF